MDWRRPALFPPGLAAGFHLPWQDSTLRLAWDNKRMARRNLSVEAKHRIAHYERFHIASYCPENAPQASGSRERLDLTAQGIENAAQTVRDTEGLTG
jgi:hypothetical protein